MKGRVHDAASRLPIRAATVEVSGRLHTTRTTADGEFWRLLLPGTYRINVSGLLSMSSDSYPLERYFCVIL